MSRHSDFSAMVRKLVFFNLPFLVYFLHYFCGVDSFFLNFSIGLIVFFIPGLSWVFILHRKIKFAGDYIFAALLFSTVFAIAGYAAYFVLGVPINSAKFSLFLFFITNAGVFIKFLFYRQINEFALLGKKAVIISTSIFLTLYISLNLFGVLIVPPLEDNDLELQATAYGIANELKPYFLTDRKTPLYFAHPPLINFYVSNYFLLSDKLEGVKPYYDIAKIGEEIQKGDLEAGSEIELYSGGSRSSVYRIERAEGKRFILNAPLKVDTQIDYGRYLPRGEKSLSDSEVKDALLWNLIKKEYKYFQDNPQILTTRSANIFLSALSGALIFYCLYLLSGSVFFPISALLLYFSFPSVLVLTTGEMYHAISTLALLFMFMAYIRYRREKETLMPVLIGVFSGLVNHKIFMLPLAVLLRDTYIYLKKKDKPRIGAFRVNGLVRGFLAGSIIFWAYGLMADKEAFLLDHFKYHFLNRILHIQVPCYSGYFSFFKLWGNFLTAGFLVPSLCILLFFLGKKYKERPVTDIMALWFLIGAISYSLIDWKEITHLALVILPLLISTVLFFSKSGKIGKIVFYVFLLFILAQNLLFLSNVLGDPQLIINKLGWN